MPGMPVFQDSPSQLKGQIYVLNGSKVEPLKVDNTGNLNVAGTVGLSSGTTVGLAAGTNAIGTVGLSSGTTVGLAAGTNAIGTVGLSSGTTVGLSSGTTVGLAAGTNVIGSFNNELVFTSVDSFGDSTILTSKVVGIGATVNSDSQDISKETSYNWYIKNTGTTDSDQDITVMVQLSPDGGTNWINDTGTAIPVPFNTAKMITVNNFLKNARFVITGGSEATTVISCYQAQH